MKTLLLLLKAFMLTMPLYAQKIVGVEYFFNTDPGAGKGIALAVNSGDSVLLSESVSLNGLKSGIHYVYVRSLTDQGIWSPVAAEMFYLAKVNSFESAYIVAAEYFFDKDNGEGTGSPINADFSNNAEVQIMIPVEGLSEGFHQLYIRVQKSDGVWSAVEQRQIYVMKSSASKITAAEYYFNTDPGQGNGSALTVNAGDSVHIVAEISIPFSNPGIQYLYIRTRNEEGHWSQVASKQLYISPRLKNGPINAAEYFFDQDPGFGKGQQIAVSSGDEVQFVAEINIDQLSTGFHFLYVRTQNSDGIWSLPESQLFYVSKSLSEIVRAEYFFDDQDPGPGVATPLLINSADTEANYSIALPGNMMPGEHTITMRVQQGNLGWNFSETQRFLVEQLHSLPVTLLYFKGWLNQQTINLKWEIAADINAKEFVIERSRDGKIFTAISAIIPNDKEPLYSFSYTDRDVTEGEYYYRLKHTGVDDKTAYSGVLYFKAEKKLVLRLYPNPAVNNLQVVMPDSGKPATIMVINQQGQIVLKRTVSISSIEMLDISRLAAGNYQLLLEQDGKRYVESFVKRR